MRQKAVWTVMAPIALAVLAGCAEMRTEVQGTEPAQQRSREPPPLTIRLARAAEGLPGVRALARGIDADCQPVDVSPPPHPPTPAAQCVIPVTVYWLGVGQDQVNHCVVSAPNVRVWGTGPGGRPARMVWALAPGTAVPAGVSYGFQNDHGILVVSDNFPPGQLTKGGRGNGFSSGPHAPADPGKFFYWKNGRSDRGVRATYYPLVLQTWTDAQGMTQEALCAAIDPTIINEN